MRQSEDAFIYVGCFVNCQDFQNAVRTIRKNPLENDIQEPHITFEYKPEQVDTSLFGTEIQIKIVGYGNDGVNEGVKVIATSANPVLQAMIDHLEVPHITIAVSHDGKPVNTKNLSFEGIEPIVFSGKYGGFTKGGKVTTQEAVETLTR